MKLAAFAQPNHIVASQALVDKLEMDLPLPKPHTLQLKNPPITIVVYQLFRKMDSDEVLSILEVLDHEDSTKESHTTSSKMESETSVARRVPFLITGATTFKDAYQGMSYLTLKFNDANIEKQFREAQVKGSLGIFILCLVIMLLVSAVYCGVRSLLFGFDNIVTIMSYALWFLEAVIIGLVIFAYFSKKKANYETQGRNCLVFMTQLIESILFMHIVGSFLLATFFLLTLIEFALESEGIYGYYIAIEYYIGLLSATIFSLLSSLYINIITTLYAITFIALSFGLPLIELRSYSLHILPMTIMVFLGVIITNYRYEHVLRLNFSYRLLLAEKSKKAASLRQESDRLLLNILPQTVVQK
jgi:hypothetical protein